MVRNVGMKLGLFSKPPPPPRPLSPEVLVLRRETFDVADL